MAIDPIEEGDADARLKMNEVITKANLVDSKASASALAAESAAREAAILALPLPLPVQHRPGDAPIDYGRSLADGEADAIVSLPSSLLRYDEAGKVVRLTGDDIVAPRHLYALEPGRRYLVTFAVQRRVNSPDPDNDAIRCAIAWYGQVKGRLAGGSAQTIAQDLLGLTTGSGRQVVRAVVARSAGVDVDIVAPASARYARPFVQTYGTLVQNDVEVINWTDITDAVAFAPDVSALDDRVATVESLDAGDRIDALEGQVTAPNTLRIATRGDLAATAVPVSADTVELLGSVVAGVGGHRRRRVASANPATDADASGAFWEIAEREINVDIFGTVGDGVADDTAAIKLAILAAQFLKCALRVPGKVYRLTEKLENAGAGLVIYADEGAVFYFDHLDIGIHLTSASNAYVDLAYCGVFGLETRRNQPVPGPGWAPVAADYDIACHGVDCWLDEIMFRNPTKALQQDNTSNGYGRLQLGEIYGQPFQVGLEIYSSADVLMGDSIRWWPFWADQADVTSYMVANLEGIRTFRVDGLSLDKYFSIRTKRALAIYQHPGGRTMLRGQINAIYADGTNCGIYAEPGTTGATMQVNQMVAFGRGAGSGSLAISLSGGLHKIEIGSFEASNHPGSLTSIGGGGHRVTIGASRISNWNLDNVAAPAFNCTPSSLLRLLSQPIREAGGNGAAILANHNCLAVLPDYFAQGSESQNSAATSGAPTGTFSGGTFAFQGWGAAATGPWIELDHSRGGSAGTHAALQSGDVIGGVAFGGSNGTAFVQMAAMTATVSSAPGTYYPTAIRFSVTDGTTGLAQRVQVRGDGALTPLTDNAYTLGASGLRWSAVWFANATIQTSDARAKTDIADSVLGLDWLMQLRPVSYRFIEGSKRVLRQIWRDAEGNEIPEGEPLPDGVVAAEIITESIPGARTHWGFIAQEVKASLPAGVDFGGWVLGDKDDPESEQGLRYEEMLAPLVKALQEAVTELRALREEFETYRGSHQ